MDIDISGIDKAKLLAALHNGTAPQGLGFLQARGQMNETEAKQFITTTRADGIIHLDYVQGRPIKVTLDGNTLRRASLYDRDAPGGAGSCQRIVDSLRSGK